MKKYKRIVITAKSPNQDIWLADDEGFLVVKKNGKIDEGLLPGKYSVRFGLHSDKDYPIDLQDDMEFQEP